MPASASNDSESLPLLSDSQRAEGDNPDRALNRDSPLSFSHEFRPFEKSSVALAICLVNVVVYFGIAVAAYGYGFEKWGVVDAIYFAVVIFTTIGYGDLSPTSDASRLFTIFFALYGIGILGAFLSIIGSAFLDASHKLMSKSQNKKKRHILTMFSESDDSDDDLENESFFRKLCTTVIFEFPIIAGILVLACLLGIPSNRSIIESIYFSVVSATTIGFGDFYPESTGMRAACIFYLPLCVGVFGQVLSKIGGVYMELKEREVDKGFLKRSLSLSDLKAMDADGDGRVCYGEFLSFILVAMEKVEQDDVDEVKRLFESLDVTRSGFLEKQDLIKRAKGESG